MADIEAMFHQVKITPGDSDALQFLWWSQGDLDKQPQLRSVCIKTADDNVSNSFEEAARAVKDNFYVDDCLVSMGTQQEAIDLASNLRELLVTGGFRLTKWVSNYYDVIASIPPSERAASVVDLDLDNSPIERTLGVSWDVEADAFTFKVTPKEKPPTRRGILSVTSSLYDPLREGTKLHSIIEPPRMTKGTRMLVRRALINATPDNLIPVPIRDTSEQSK
ncbi:uncharacterized protein [Diadema setosum]|uniref:uncharacterized protein n=1 Tax=Diadema setosum TaxID=31175 RepID=UPI003B3A2990